MKTLLISLIFLFILSCSSSVQMLGKSRTPIASSEVEEFAVLPPQVEAIADMTVTVFSHSDGSESTSQIKNKAASLGANGYVIIGRVKTENGTDQNGQPRPHTFRISAKLFYVSE